MRPRSIHFLPYLVASLKDLLPILLIIGFFQFLVIGQPLDDLDVFLQGALLVMIGLALFVYGLELGVFPLGEQLARAFARKANVPLLLAFAFFLGFSTTIAEPALIAIATEASRVAADEGHITDSAQSLTFYALGLRITVALAVGCALIIGVLRIILGWPLHHLIIGGYMLVIALSHVAPPEIIGIAFDSGGITTSTITVPLVTALGVGLASSIKGRSPIADGFGLIAFASLAPMLFVMLFGLVVHG